MSSGSFELVVVSKQGFLNIQLARVQINSKQEGTTVILDEVFLGVGAQDMDTSRYQVSDLEDIEFDWEEPDLNIVTVFRPGRDTPFSHSTFNDFEIGSLAENSILIDEEQYKENSSSLPITPVSERQT